MFRNLLSPSEWSGLQMSALFLFLGMFMLMLVRLFGWKTKGDYASAEQLPLSDGDQIPQQREVMK